MPFGWRTEEKENLAFKPGYLLIDD